MKQSQRVRRPKRELQPSFEFLDRLGRHEQWFKRIVVCATLLAIVLPLAVLPRGRYLVAKVASLARRAARMALNRPTPRAEVDQDWERFRRQGIADSHQRLIDIYESTVPAYQ